MLNFFFAMADADEKIDESSESIPLRGESCRDLDGGVTKIGGEEEVEGGELRIACRFEVGVFGVDWVGVNWVRA